MTFRYIQGHSLAEYLLRAASGDSTLMTISMQWKAELLQELCLVSTVALQAGALVVLYERTVLLQPDKHSVVVGVVVD